MDNNPRLSSPEDSAVPKRVLIIGLDPSLIDFSEPDYAAFPGLDAAKVLAGLTAEKDRLTELGYDPHLCLTDFGETAEMVVRETLRSMPFDCVLIGAGVRTVPRHFLLFERLLNVVHEFAPKARLCFNTKPTDTADAVRRWV